MRLKFSTSKINEKESHRSHDTKILSVGRMRVSATHHLGTDVRVRVLCDSSHANSRNV